MGRMGLLVPPGHAPSLQRRPGADLLRHGGGQPPRTSTAARATAPALPPPGAAAAVAPLGTWLAVGTAAGLGIAHRRSRRRSGLTYCRDARPGVLCRSSMELVERLRPKWQKDLPQLLDTTAALDDWSFLEVQEAAVRGSVLRHGVPCISGSATLPQSFRLQSQESGAAGLDEFALALGLGLHSLEWQGEKLFLLHLAGEAAGDDDQLVLLTKGRGPARGAFLAAFCRAAAQASPRAAPPVAAPPPVVATAAAANPPAAAPKFWIQELVDDALREAEEEEARAVAAGGEAAPKEAPEPAWTELSPEESEKRGSDRLGLDFDPLA
mmetsp:Transcript_12773/g.33134  ORF Transcript_12773/g.33134 Transcript_12773/m.33134 type:complete len:324 (-) Transcript_12773:109-1080(-)